MLDIIFSITVHLVSLIVLLGSTILSVGSLLDLIDVNVKWKGLWWNRKNIYNESKKIR